MLRYKVRIGLALGAICVFSLFEEVPAQRGGGGRGGGGGIDTHPERQFLVSLLEAPEDGAFYEAIWSSMQTKPRYKGRSVLAILDAGGRRALLLGTGVSAGRMMAEQTLWNRCRVG